MPPLLRERHELPQRCGGLRGGGPAFPLRKRRCGPSGALSPAAGQRAGVGGGRCPRDWRAGARRGARFPSRLSGTSPQRAAANFGGSAASPLPVFSAARGGARLPAEPTAARFFPAAGGLALAAGWWVPGERRRRGAVRQPAGRGAAGSSPAVVSPARAGGWGSSGPASGGSPAWDDAAPADRVRVGNFSSRPPSVRAL